MCPTRAKRTSSAPTPSRPASLNRSTRASKRFSVQPNQRLDNPHPGPLAAPLPTFKLTLQYDGTSYAGAQRQPDQPTIQEAVEKAILQVSQPTVSVIAAGRTDAGVHALGQVARFRTDRTWAPTA